MAPIAWDEAVPDDMAPLSQGAGEIRALKASVREGLETSMYWSDGASMASAGVMKRGSLRGSYGLESSLSLTGDNGHLVVTHNAPKIPSTTTYQRLYVTSSSVTSFRAGGSHHLDHPVSVTTGARWVVSSATSINGGQVGDLFQAAAGTYYIHYGVEYNGIPRAWIGHSVSKEHTLLLSSVTQSGMQISKVSMPSYYDSQAENSFVAWASLGTVSF